MYVRFMVDPNVSVTDRFYFFELYIEDGRL